MMTIAPHAPIRIARPSQDLAAAERFWVEGVGLDVLWRSDHDVEDGHGLTMVGVPGATWHLELVDDAATAAAHEPTPEDLLVIYLGEPPAPEWLARIEAAGGRRTPSRNPYWDRWGVTVVDPDGYRLVLSRRTWGEIPS
jgi:catechol 2,3-dioxygenase-like lactoylglutathione lyase family enzyme